MLGHVFKLHSSPLVVILNSVIFHLPESDFSCQNQSNYLFILRNCIVFSCFFASRQHLILNCHPKSLYLCLLHVQFFSVNSIAKMQFSIPVEDQCCELHDEKFMYDWKHQISMAKYFLPS